MSRQRESQAQGGILECPVQGLELDSVIPVAPFQFHDSVVYLCSKTGSQSSLVNTSCSLGSLTMMAEPWELLLPFPMENVWISSQA